MRVSLEWLGDFVDLGDVAPARVAELLTMSGTEVERIIPFSQGLGKVVVGEVVGLSRLAGSDHLWLASVRDDEGSAPKQVVCGAPNLSEGALVPWARPGTKLPSGLEIGSRRIRGVVSQGMLCAPDELGLGSDHEGVLILAPGDAEVGQPLAELYPPDTVLELEILSNRADCLSHWGVARELAALLGRPLRDPDTGPPGSVGGEAVEISVSISDPGFCPLYLARSFTGIPSTPAPLWLRRRLQAVGQRSVSGIVDVANYVMLEVGQPVHTFDLDRLPRAGSGVAVGVRPGRPGERLLCLDRETRSLGPEIPTVTVGDAPAALAGIMGGLDTAVGETTHAVLLEAASFAWPAVRRASRLLGLRTEASSRFERFLSSRLAPVGSARFARLLTEVIGGEAGAEAAAIGEESLPPSPIRIATSQIAGLLGLQVSPQRAADVLGRLQFQVEIAGEELLAVPPPTRTDIGLPVDLVEEVGRVIGYQEVTATLPASRRPPSLEAGSSPAARMVVEIAIGAGFSECVSGSLTGLEQLEKTPGLAGERQPIPVDNPLSAQLGWLRLSLLPGLLECCQLNQSRGRERVRLFEQGAAFWPSFEGRPEEPALVALVDQEVDDSPDASAVRLRHLLQVCQALGQRVGDTEVRFQPAPHAGFHPTRCAEVWVDKTLRGLVGELDRSLTGSLDLRGRVVAGELRVDGWLRRGGRPSQGVVLARTPALVMDLSVTVPARALMGDAREAIRGLGLAELESIRLLDQYQGTGVPEGAKGWTFRMLLRDPARTLTNRDGERLREAVLVALRDSVGATPR